MGMDSVMSNQTMVTISLVPPHLHPGSASLCMEQLSTLLVSEGPTSVQYELVCNYPNMILKTNLTPKYFRETRFKMKHTVFQPSLNWLLAPQQVLKPFYKILICHFLTPGRPKAAELLGLSTCLFQQYWNVAVDQTFTTLKTTWRVRPRPTEDDVIYIMLVVYLHSWAHAVISSFITRCMRYNRRY